VAESPGEGFPLLAAPALMLIDVSVASCDGNQKINRQNIVEFRAQ
jgi:hypothetical protein